MATLLRTEPGLGSALRAKRRILASAFVGTTIEWYDFYLYGTASALVFNKQFFPDASPLVGVLASFATYAVGFIARPLGGVISGHLGDRIGRKALLVASLLTMGIASTLIGVLPNYASIGILAVVGLVGLRLIQGLSAGAEWGGSALLSVEHAPAGRKGLFGSFTQVGSAAGMLLATGAYALTQAFLTPEQFQSFGWRLPFLLSGVLVLIGLWIRLGVTDAEEFTAVKDSEGIAARPVARVLREHPRGILVTIGMRLVQPAIYTLMTVYILGYLKDRRHDTTSGLAAILIVSAIGLLSGPFWGWLSDRVGRRRIAVAASAGVVVLIWPFFWFLDHGSLTFLPLVLLVGMNILHDAIYGPQAAWFAEQFPTELRYSGVSFGYQVGTVLSAAVTPLVAAALLQAGGGTPWLVCGWFAVLGVLTTVAALAAKDPVVQAAGQPATPEGGAAA
ncbi:MFS transporter [Sinomonas atrocyanea]|uniref:MFS transporter n=1 Tax=Sinomonas atrocyanea TaxID=37927 RepID=UPI00278A6EE6|nr:MFS transporter [Sinomonas atrocyanea]MDQ0260714.1 MFS family permease [Sinomonas atrocyanea]MDR6622303.1 MFS family permease [Sinomonas atrocyanea]